MKLSSAWFGFRNQTLSNYLSMAAGLGIRYVELPLYGQLMEDYTHGFDYKVREGVELLLGTAQEAGVTPVAGVANLPIGYSALNVPGTVDEKRIQFAQAAARFAIGLASEIGMTVVRVTEPEVPPGMESQAVDRMDAVGRALKTLGDHAAEHGVVLVVENYGIQSQHLLRILDVADHPQVKTLYDPCNYFRLGEDPSRALQQIGVDRVGYVHLKDAKKDDKRAPSELFKTSRWAPSLPVGDGDIDWHPILRRLESSYSGYTAIEYEMADDVLRGTYRSLSYIGEVIQNED